MGERVSYTFVIIDDDAADVALLQKLLEGISDIAVSCFHCETPEQCAQVLQQHAIDLAFICYRFDAARDFTFIRQLQQFNPDMSLIILTQSGDERITAQIVRWGPCDYLSKDELTSIRVRRAVESAVGTISRKRERRLAETLLRLNEQNYRSLIDTIPDIVLVHRAGRILFANQATQSVLGYTEQEVLGRSVLEFIATDRDKQAVVDAMTRRGAGEDVPEYEIDIVDKKAHIHSVIVRASRTMFNDEPAFQVVLIDITERKRLEEELLRTRKLESLGLLAGGIAHDFNNILAGIVSGIAAAKMHAHPGSELYGVLDEIERASFKASELTQELLTFSQGGEPVRNVCSVHRLVEQALRFSFLGDNVDYSLSIPETVLNVVADRSQISQALSNLIINAAQAMPTGGTISITCSNVFVGSHEPPREIETAKLDETVPLGEGLYVRICVRDTGMGIPKENLQKVFDPYFTTKPSGTGLGLATVFSVLQKHNGHVSVESEVGAGTTFCIFVPASLEPCEERVSDTRLARASSGRILVMDDDQTILYTLEKFLSAIGYSVTCVKDGETAIETYRAEKQRGKQYLAVLMDLTIPRGLGGKRAVERLLKYDPDAKAIAISGYCDDPVLANFQAHGFVGVLRKPFKPQDLDMLLKDIAAKRI